MQGAPKAYSPNELARRSRCLSGDGLPLVTAGTIRSMMARKENPLPHVECGEKRPHKFIFEDVFYTYLAYEMGAADYAEVVEVARRGLMGARA